MSTPVLSFSPLSLPRRNPQSVSNASRHLHVLPNASLLHAHVGPSDKQASATSPSYLINAASLCTHSHPGTHSQQPGPCSPHFISCHQAGAASFSLTSDQATISGPSHSCPFPRECSCGSGSFSSFGISSCRRVTCSPIESWSSSPTCPSSLCLSHYVFYFPRSTWPLQNGIFFMLCVGHLCPVSSLRPGNCPPGTENKSWASPGAQKALVTTPKSPATSSKLSSLKS